MRHRRRLALLGAAAGATVSSSRKRLGWAGVRRAIRMPLCRTQNLG